MQEAIRQGFAFIAITDHRFGGIGNPCGDGAHACDDNLCQEVVETCRNDTRLLCIPGMEVTGRLHVTALGIQQGIDERLPLTEIVRQIHMQGGFAIAAHPYLDPWVYTDQELYHSGLDAMECEYGDELHRLPCIYSSDAHTIANMAIHSVCYESIKTFDDLKMAINSNQCYSPPTLSDCEVIARALPQTLQEITETFGIPINSTLALLHENCGSDIVDGFAVGGQEPVTLEVYPGGCIDTLSSTTNSMPPQSNGVDGQRAYAGRVTSNEFAYRMLCH